MFSGVTNLFNNGTLTIQQAVELGTKGYVLVCADGKVTNIMYEPKED